MFRIHPLVFIALACAGCGAFGATQPNTALSAVKLLPKGAVGRIALIEGRDGNPAPDRWHILVSDPKEENGLHEYVVAGGEIVASRSLSQFAESLTPDDVFGDVVKVDSDKAAKLAQQYAEANAVNFAEINFELKKDGAAAAPLWSVTCLDDEGNEVGRLVLTATKGTILSHEGFAAEPLSADKSKEKDKDKDPNAAVIVAAIPDKKPPEPEKKSPEPRKIEVKKAEPVVDGQPPEERKPGFFNRAFQKIFPGKPKNPPATPAPANPPPQ